MSKHAQILKDCMNPVILEVAQCRQTSINKKQKNYGSVIKGENPEVTPTAYWSALAIQVLSPVEVKR